MNDWSPKDPRWTQYVLDELPPEIREEAEKKLRADPALQAEIDRLRQTTLLLREALLTPVPGESDAVSGCREAVDHQPAPLRGHPRLRVVLPTAIAAMLAVGLGLNHMFQWGPARRADSTRPAPESATILDADVEPDTLPEVSRDDPLMRAFRLGEADAPAEPLPETLPSPAPAAPPVAAEEAPMPSRRARMDSLSAAPAGRGGLPPAQAPAAPPEPAADLAEPELGRMQTGVMGFADTMDFEAEPAEIEDTPEDPVPLPAVRTEGVTAPLAVPTPTPTPTPTPVPLPETIRHLPQEENHPPDPGE